MKRLIIATMILAGFAMQATAQSFQSGDLLYSVICSNPPCVSLDGHVDGTNAQGELIIPETVEHEETVTMPRFLSQYGLEKASFKISLDPNVINALKVLDHLGLRSLKPVEVDGVKVIPRDVVAACAPQPKDIGDELTGEMVVGVLCIGEKDGQERKVFIYQPFDQKKSMDQWNSQAVTMQTGWGAALAIELIARGIWREPGVYSPEYFDPDPYMALMRETGYRYEIEDRSDRTRQKKVV